MNQRRFLSEVDFFSFIFCFMNPGGGLLFMYNCNENIAVYPTVFCM